MLSAIISIDWSTDYQLGLDQIERLIIDFLMRVLDEDDIQVRTLN